jgi:hypothetical protein
MTERAGADHAVDPERFLDRLIHEGGMALRKAGFRTRLMVAGVAGARFLDPDDPIRQAALARLPADAGFSAEMAVRVLDGMARDWTAERLAVAVRQDFPDPDVLEGFRPGTRGERVRVVPPRLLVQVGAGNVPGTGATALLRGFIVGAPTLVKPGRGDGVLPALMAQALAEAAPELAAGFAVVPWVGGEGGALEAQALARAERVVVYGGEEAVTAVQQRVHPLTPVVVHGPKVSVGVVLRESTGEAAVVHDAAAAITAYEQRGCVSPHVIWVEAGGERDAAAWAEALARALAEEEARWPSPVTASGSAERGDSERSVPERSDPERSVPERGDPELRGLRVGMRTLAETTAFRAAAGQPAQVHGGPEVGWMVVVEPEHEPFEPSCLGRTVRVRPLAHGEAVAEALASARGLLQSVALEGGEPRRTLLALELARAGATRITTFRDQPWPPAWWRHDGRGALAELVHWVTLEPRAVLRP